MRSEAGGPVAFPHHYALLEDVHRRLRPATYVEIGVDTGLSLRAVRPGTAVVGVDPVLGPDVVAAHPDARLVATTSDDFFATHDLRSIFGGRAVDLAFIDGMHRFEYVLRDLANLQPHCDEHSVVLIHDCLPTDAACAARERSTIAWAGDVWRAAHALATEWRASGFVTLDVPPTGMGVLTGLGSAEPLIDRVEDWAARYATTDYEVLARDPEAAVNRRVVTSDLLEGLFPTPHP